MDDLTSTLTNDVPPVLMDDLTSTLTNDVPSYTVTHQMDSQNEASSSNGIHIDELQSRNYLENSQFMQRTDTGNEDFPNVSYYSPRNPIDNYTVTFDFANVTHSPMTDISSSTNHTGQTLQSHQSTASNDIFQHLESPSVFPCSSNTENPQVGNIPDEQLSMQTNDIPNNMIIDDAQNDVLLAQWIDERGDAPSASPSRYIPPMDEDVQNIKFNDESSDNAVLQSSSYSPTVVAENDLPVTRDIASLTYMQILSTNIENISNVSEDSQNATISEDLQNEALGLDERSDVQPASPSAQLIHSVVEDSDDQSDVQPASPSAQLIHSVVEDPDERSDVQPASPSAQLIHSVVEDSDERSDVQPASPSAQLIHCVVEDIDAIDRNEVSSSSENKELPFSSDSTMTTAMDKPKSSDDTTMTPMIDGFNTNRTDLILRSVDCNNAGNNEEHQTRVSSEPESTQITDVSNEILPSSEDLPNSTIIEDVLKDAMPLDDGGDVQVAVPTVTEVINSVDEDLYIIECDDTSSISSSESIETKNPPVFICSVCNLWLCQSREELEKHTQLMHTYDCGICTTVHATKEAVKACFLQHLGRVERGSQSVIRRSSGIKGGRFKSHSSRTEENKNGHGSAVPIRYSCPICIDNGNPRPCTKGRSNELKRHVLLVHGAVLPDLQTHDKNYDPLTTRVLIAGSMQEYKLKRNTATDKSTKAVNREYLLSLIKASKVPESSTRATSRDHLLTKRAKSEASKIDVKPSKNNPDSVSAKIRFDSEFAVDSLKKFPGYKSKRLTNKPSHNSNAIDVNIDKPVKVIKSAKAGSDKNVTNMNAGKLEADHSLRSTKKQRTNLSTRRSKLVNARIMSTKSRTSRLHLGRNSQRKLPVRSPMPSNTENRNVASAESVPRYTCPVCIDMGRPLQINTTRIGDLQKHALKMHFVVLPDLKKDVDYDPLTTRVLIADTGKEYKRKNCTSGVSGKGVAPTNGNCYFSKYLLSPNSKENSDKDASLKKDSNKSVAEQLCSNDDSNLVKTRSRKSESLDKSNKAAHNESATEQLHSNKDSMIVKTRSQKSDRFDKSNKATNKVSNFEETNNVASRNSDVDKNDGKDPFVASAFSVLQDTIRCVTKDKNYSSRDSSVAKILAPQSKETRNTLSGDSHNKIHKEQNLKRKMSFDGTPKIDLTKNEGRRTLKRQRNEANFAQNCEVSVFRDMDREIARSMELERLELSGEFRNSAGDNSTCGYSMHSNESISSSTSPRNARKTSGHIFTHENCGEKISSHRNRTTDRRESTDREKYWTKNENREMDNLNRSKDRESYGGGDKKDWMKDDSRGRGKDTGRVRNWVNDQDREMEGWNNDGRKNNEKGVARTTTMTRPLSVDVRVTGNDVHLPSPKYRSASRMQRSPTGNLLPGSNAAQEQSLSVIRRKERRLRDQLSQSLSTRIGPWVAGEVYRDVLLRFPVEDSVVVGRELMEVGQRFSEASEYILNEAERRVAAGQDVVRAYRDVTRELQSGFY